MTSVFDHHWLGGLFGDAEAAELWSPDAQLSHYKAFERALALAMGSCGLASHDKTQAAAGAISKAEIDMSLLREGSRNDGLPVPALVRQLRRAAADAADAVHTGATSQDVLDTATALTLKATTSLLLARIRTLQSALTDLESTFGDRPLMGRTRMQAALQITVADRIKSWKAPLAHHLAALEALQPDVERLQLGGAVGTRAAFGDQADAMVRTVAEILDLHAGSVWHTDRSVIADYASRLSAITGSLGKMGQDIALMAQQGVDEVVLSGGGGSSAMPHKSNPISAELLVTLARFNATQLAGMHQALVHEQERSGAAWMLEWMLLPSMCVASARALAVAHDLCRSIDDMGTR